MKPIQPRLILALALCALWLGPPGTLGAAPAWKGLMNYQGQLTDSAGNAMPDATYAGIVFRIYNVASGGASLWTETQSITTSKGLFNVVLGSINPLTNLAISNYNSDLWIGILVPPDALEMTPRQQLLPSSTSINANALQGLFPNNLANNIPVLDGSGRLPQASLAGGGLIVPFDLTGTSATYLLNVTNSNAGANALGIVSKGSNGLSATASLSTGYGIWGMSAPADGATAMGMRASAGSGYGLVAESVSGFAISATVGALDTNPAIIAQGKFGISAYGTGTGIAIQAATQAGNLVANLVDKVNNAGVYTNVSAVNTMGVSATSSTSTGVLGRTTSVGPLDYGVWGDNTGGGTGIYGTGAGKGVYGLGGTYGVYGSGSYGVYGTGTSYGVYGSSGSIGVYGNTTGSQYGVYGNSNAGGIGVYGVGTWGVYGGAQFAQSNARGVYGEGNSFGSGVFGNSAAAGFFGVEGVHTGSAEIAVHGDHQGGGAGVGVKGESDGANGIGVWGRSSAGPGVQGSGGSIGVSGTGSTTGVYGSAPTYGVEGYSPNNYGVYGHGYYGVFSPGTFLGVYASGGTYGSYNSGGTYGVYATSSTYGVFSSGSNSDYYANGGGSYGFFLSNGSAPANGIGVYSNESCATCYSGHFQNTAATSGAGAALNVYGRIRIQPSTGAGLTPTGVGTYSAGTCSVWFYNSYITTNSLVLLTSKTAGSNAVVSVTSVSAGQCILNFNPCLNVATQYQYLIIGQ